MRRRSPAELLALLPPAERTRHLASLSPAARADLLWHWPFWARPAQTPPPGDWATWLFLAGRGSGKTRAGAEWVRSRIKAGSGYVALIAPTAGDARHVMVEGESGLLSVCSPRDVDRRGAHLGRPEYLPSLRQVQWANGARATMFSAEEPERLRGPQHSDLWADELAAWKRMRETWDMAQFGLRLPGARPRAMVTTTPKPRPLLKELLADAGTVVTRGSTFDNEANLAPQFLTQIRKRYEGTALGRQELYAEMLEDAEGALWSRDMLEQAAAPGLNPDVTRIVVAVDPAVTKTDASDETGIVVAGTDGEMLFVLDDASGRYSPSEWANRVAGLYRKYRADRVVAEVNNGGDMVEAVLRQVAPSISYRAVRAAKGKRTRAEPVAALYEQGRAKHCAPLGELEDQMATWEPLSGHPSPDRLDALVWAATDLMLSGDDWFFI